VGVSELGITALPRLLAVEVLLAEPEDLGDDVLEGCLYILRDRLQGKDDGDRFPVAFERRSVPKFIGE
jgi:hypothetical protein